MCINELIPSVKITPELLKQPEADKIRSIYEAVVERVLEKTRDEYAGAREEGIPALEHPELHELSVPELNFFRDLFQVMQACGIQDFTLRDVSNPTDKRTCAILSGIINFVRFREDQIQTYNSLTGQTELLVTERDAIAEEELKSATELAALREEVAAEEPQVKIELEAVSKAQTTISQLNEQQAALQNQIHETKGKIQTAVNKHTQLRDQVNTLKQNNLRLRSMIVQSPEKAKRNIEEMAVSLEKERKVTLDYEAKQRELQARVDHMYRINHDLKGCMQLLELTATEFSRKDEVKARIAQKRQMIQDLEQELRDLELSEQQWSRQLQTIREKLGRLERIEQERTVEWQQILSKLNEERAQIEKERLSIKQRVTQNELLILEFKSEEETLRRDHTEEMGKMGELFEFLYRQVEEYHHQLATMLTAQ
jgi:kinetochore protein Nuf2